MQNPESETAQKKAEADRLRAAEKFMVVGTGEATCAGCGYDYLPKNGDPEYPITPGTLFPVCSSSSDTLQLLMVAGRMSCRLLACKPVVLLAAVATLEAAAMQEACMHAHADSPQPLMYAHQNLPEDWSCPICGAPKTNFQTKAREIAGFAENQRYGLGTNSMTSGQKSLLIFGSLLAFFFLFLAGYFIQ